MKTNKLLAAAILAIAIGAPIAVFIGDKNVAQPTPSTVVLPPFLHGFPLARLLVNPSCLPLSARTNGSIRRRCRRRLSAEKSS
jgi:hypothetical protein